MSTRRSSSATSTPIQQQQLLDLKLPIGWASNPPQADKDMYLGVPNTAAQFGDTLGHLLGWLVTAVAATLGAPFRFDMLNKIMSVRSAGMAPEEMPSRPRWCKRRSGRASRQNRRTTTSRSRDRRGVETSALTRRHQRSASVNTRPSAPAGGRTRSKCARVGAILTTSAYWP